MNTRVPEVNALVIPRVAIIILNWNGRDDTLACLQSVMKIDYANFWVIVVDNGSNDNSVAAIRAAQPHIDIVETGANLGFAGGNNAGIRHSLDLGADYVLLLNNDTEVDPGLLRAFVSAAQRHPQAGALSARIYYHDEPHRIWYAGARWSFEHGRFHQVGQGEIDAAGVFDQERETDYACGCAFFVPATRFREIGLLDDDFFLYFEETDWCYRARRAGHPSVYVPDAKLWHKISVSFGGEKSPLATYFITRNRLLWAKRHLGARQRLSVYLDTLRILSQRFIAPMGGLLRQRPLTLRARCWSAKEIFRDPVNQAYFLGVRDFCIRRFGNCPERVRVLGRKWSAGQARRKETVRLSH